jgi:hypothetical protein
LSGVDDPPCFVAKQDCRLFCSLQWPVDTQPHWDVGVIVRTIRTYISTEIPLRKQTTETQQLLALRIRWEQGMWHVSFHRQGESFSDDPNCHAMISTLLTDPHYQSSAQSHWIYISGFNRAQGCVAVMQPDDPSQAISAPATAETLLFLRFGVLLTASTRASHQWPALSKVSVHEQDLVEEILRHPAFVS